VAKSKKYVARVDASERVLSGGRVAVPGDPISLDDDAQKDEHNARLIEEGQLLEVTETSKSGGEQ
jgi:hypothetical protein